MTETVREQQRRIVRERIAEGAAEVIVDEGLSGLSMASVAEKAGVALRTVYNYADSRDAVFDLVCEVADARIYDESIVTVRSFDELLEAISQNMRFFAELGALGDARLVIRAERAVSGGRATGGPANWALTDFIASSIADLAPDLSDDHVDALTALMRLLISSDSWYRLRNAGIGLDDSARSVSWAVRVLHQALESGDTPFTA